MSHEFLDPFTLSEIDYRRARLTSDWALLRRRGKGIRESDPQECLPVFDDAGAGLPEPVADIGSSFRACAGIGWRPWR